MSEERIEIEQEPVEAEIKAGLVEVKASDLEANPEEKEAIAEQQEVPNKEAAVETIRALRVRCGNLCLGALKDLCGNQHLAVRCRGWPKKWT
jgi:hypothetical protein